jgi:segregation and condensation protein A
MSETDGAPDAPTEPVSPDAQGAEAAPAQAAPEAPSADEGLPSFRAGTEELSIEARGRFADKEIAGYVPSPESEQLLVRLSLFEGPLDLLLHLLDKHALDVFDIPIRTVVDEYMKAIDHMRDLNLDVAGEFLVMAAQLAHIKSKMLLPREERPVEGVPETDPRAELVRRLLEYQRFKEVAQKLDEMPQMGRDLFARPIAPIRYDGPVGSFAEDIYTQLNLAEVDPFELIRLFDGMLRKQQKTVIHEVLLERISVGARINELVDIIGDGTPRTFAALCDAFGQRTRRSVIVTFLAVLEMTRLRLTRVRQAEDGTIEIHPILDNLRADEDALKATLGAVQEFEGGEEPEPPAPAAEAQADGADDVSPMESETDPPDGGPEEASA